MLYKKLSIFLLVTMCVVNTNLNAVNFYLIGAGTAATAFVGYNEYQYKKHRDFLRRLGKTSDLQKVAAREGRTSETVDETEKVIAYAVVRNRAHEYRKFALLTKLQEWYTGKSGLPSDENTK